MLIMHVIVSGHHIKVVIAMVMDCQKVAWVGDLPVAGNTWLEVIKLFHAQLS